jgi:hypothetical protein
MPSSPELTVEQRTLIERAGLEVLGLEQAWATEGVAFAAQRFEGRQPPALLAARLEYRDEGDADPRYIIYSYARSLLAELHGADRVPAYLEHEARFMLATASAAEQVGDAEHPQPHTVFEQHLEHLPATEPAAIELAGRQIEVELLRGEGSWTAAFAAAPTQSAALIALCAGPIPTLTCVTT